MNALFSIFVNLSIVWLKVAGICCPSYSTCCNVTYHGASHWKFHHTYMEEWEWKRPIISYYKNSPPHKVLEQSQGPPRDHRTTFWEILISDFIWSQQSIFETHKVGITWFPLLISTFNGFSKFTKVMSGRVRINNSIL